VERREAGREGEEVYSETHSKSTDSQNQRADWLHERFCKLGGGCMVVDFAV